MNEKKENKQKNNDSDFGLQDYLGEEIENTILRFHGKKKLSHDISSDSSSEVGHIHYYENFLKSLKNENENQKQEKKTPKKNNKNCFKLKIKAKKSKEYKNNIIISRYNSNKNSISKPYHGIDNNVYNFFKMRPRSMSKNMINQKLYIDEMPIKVGESYFNFGKGNHHKFILEHSNNKINEVDESVISNQNNNDNNNMIIYYSHPKKSIVLKHNASKGNFQNKNNEIIENNNLGNKILKTNDKKENKKNNSIIPFTKDTEENLNTKNETNTLNNNINEKKKVQYSIKKKKRLLCCCIPIG